MFIALALRYVTGISYGHDGTNIVLTAKHDGKEIIFLKNPEDLGLPPPIFSTTNETENNQKFTQKEVSANGLKYHVTNKKIGYSIAD